MSINKQNWTLISNDLSIKNEFLDLNEDEHHYAFHVLRLKANDQVTITNGVGLKAIAVIQEINKKNAKLKVLEYMQSKENEIAIHLFLACPKPATLDDCISIASEMGLNTLHVFKSEKISTKFPYKKAKWERLSLEATRISQSSFATQINCYENLDEIHNDFISKYQTNSIFLLCDESHIYEGKIQNSLYKVLSNNWNNSIKNICIFIGPESSFTDRERDFICNNFNAIKVSLGQNILKVPNAIASAISLSSCFRENL